MFNRLPKWVRGLQDDNTNKVLLTRIFKVSGQPLETPKKIIFAIKGFNNPQIAEAAIKEYLDKEGWKSHITHDESANKYWVQSEKANYVLQKDGLLHDEALFDRVASLYEAQYDGWTVALPPKA